MKPIKFLVACLFVLSLCVPSVFGSLLQSASNEMSATALELRGVSPLGLLHGRIYDPKLGRFLSADIIVDDPTDLQGYNRYSYVKNRPLTLTDPSGHSAAGEFFVRSHPNADRHILLKTFGVEKTDRMIAQRAEAQAAADKGTMIGGVVTLGAGALVVAGPVVVAKEAGSEIFDTVVEQTTGVPMATSIRGLSKDIFQLGVKALGKEGAEAASGAVAKRVNDVAGSVPNANRVADGAPATPSPSETGNLNVTEVPSALTSKEQKAIRKIDNAVDDHLAPKDISGAVADQSGSDIPKPGGGVWDHTKEVGDAMRGVTKNSETLKHSTDPAARAAVEKAEEALKRARDALRGTGI